jgi:hypothetical protein
MEDFNDHQHEEQPVNCKYEKLAFPVLKCGLPKRHCGAADTEYHRRRQEYSQYDV